MQPFLLKAPLKDYIWGGTRLRDEFGKESDLPRIAESWELACHKDGVSVAASGEYAGRTLAEIISEGKDIIGKGRTELPVLVKLIDASDDLSIQVHPDDDYAHEYENDNGKTEMWYVVDAAEGAELICGFKEEISEEEFRKAIEENTLMDKLKRFPVKKGDVFFISPGTLHAIGKGLLIAEIQQSSNVTYRVYDYGRLGADGKPRELHVEKAVEVTRREPFKPHRMPSPQNCGGEMIVQQLADCEYFHVFSFNIMNAQGEMMLQGAPDRFQHLLVTEGSCKLTCKDEELLLEKGSSVFVPAGSDTFKIQGICNIILTTV